MHQHPRHSPIAASPASSPRPHSNRLSNTREEHMGPDSRSGSDMPIYNETEDGNGDSAEGNAGSSRNDDLKRLDQIIQNFHTKAAIVVLQSRMSLPVIMTREGTKKVNKWFSIETDDTTAFREDLNLWKTCGAYQNRPPPLIVETYLDTSKLTSSQSLVILDEEGNRWDVAEAFNQSSTSSDGDSHTRKRNSEVVLERWKIEFKESHAGPPRDFLSSTPPTIYKKCIVFFRALYSAAKFVPAWRFVKSLGKGSSANSPLRVNCRILSEEVRPGRFDPLTQPLYESANAVTTEYSLGSTETPAGHFLAHVTYRNDCNFRVDDSEALLSSRFMGADEQEFRPSLERTRDGHRRNVHNEVGSLPANKRKPDHTEPVQAYGSLSTFHGDAAPGGSSPISALRAAKTMGSNTSSPAAESLPRSRPMHTSRVSLQTLDGITMARRPSVSFQPFKAGSLSSSPGQGQQTSDVTTPHSPSSLTRTPGGGISALAQARNRSSLTAGMPASLRGGPAVPENANSPSASSSPKPAPISRYSSSFGHRRGRSSFGGASKVLDDDQGSSGKQSLSSSTQPGSGFIAEPGADASSGSLQTDDDNISEFLKVLDSKKTLRSFEPSGEASTKRTSAQLSKFQSMRESNNALTESMSSSTMLYRSSSSSSRQLSSVPPMVAATSMSVSSSPGKPISPHTPHTPAIPSRLSANSIAEYSISRPRRLSHRNRTSTEMEHQNAADNGAGTNAIDIPTSPRTYFPHARRSSSVAQQHRNLPVEDDLGDMPFGIHRSISLGADGRDPPSLSALLNQGQTTENVATSSPSPTRVLRPAPDITESPNPASRPTPSSLDANETDTSQIPRGLSAGSTNHSYRPRLGPSGGRGTTASQNGSYSSLSERGGGSGTSERAGGRYSFTRTAGAYEADDEPLLFDMSEIGRDQSRKSTEESRGGSTAGNTDRFDVSKGGDLGSSNQKGTGRGW